ncbi:MAG: transporter permease [Actinomycetota bacterium]|nr:transporter permease [Actinomycetota bacterium]
MALRIGLSRTVLELKQFFRERDSMVFTFLFPVIMLFIFGSVFKDQELPGGVSFTQYFTAGMIATGVMLSSFQQLAISIAVERDDGTLKRLRGTPMPPAAYFLGKVGMVVLTSLVQVVIMLVCGGLLFGLDVPSDAGSWLTFTWVFLLGTASGTVVGIAFSSVPRSAKSAGAVVTPAMIVLQFISGVYFVYSELPGWMQDVGAVFPLKWLTQGMRSVFLPGSFAAQEITGSWEPGRTALVLTAWAAGGLVLCLRTFRWQRRGDR